MAPKVTREEFDKAIAAYGPRVSGHFQHQISAPELIDLVSTRAIW